MNIFSNKKIKNNRYNIKHINNNLKFKLLLHLKILELKLGKQVNI